MRCAVERDDPRLRALVAILDEKEVPLAQTWRVVAAVAEANGLLRPSYPLIRRLALRHRQLLRRRAELRQVALDAAQEIMAGRAPGFDFTAGRLLEASRRVTEAKACVSETQAGFARPP